MDDVFSDEFLLWRLQRYRDNPPLKWHLEDPCFLRVDLLRYALRDHAEAQQHAKAAVARHSRQCGYCLTNVHVTGETTEDPVRKENYETLYVLVMQACIRALGGKLDIREEATGGWSSMSPPPGLEGLLTGIDIFAPRNRTEQAVEILKAATEAVFDDPQVILDKFDSSACEALQRYQGKAAWKAVQWQAIMGRGKRAIFLHWGSQSKELPQAFDLFGRYKALMLKYGEREAGVGQALLDLRGVALEYNGQSRFSSFAKTRQRQRGIDEYRHRRADALAKGLIEIDPEAYGQDAATNAIDAKIDIDRLAAQLSGRERAVFELWRKDPDLTDSQIAEQLRVRRETVNRDRQSIRRKAQAISAA